jgi:hypothetical protein
MSLIVFDGEKAAQVGQALRSRHLAGASAVAPAVAIWQATAAGSRTAATKLRIALRALARTRGANRRRAAARAEYYAKRLAIDVDLLRTTGAGVSGAVADPALTRPLTAAQVRSLKSAIARGRARLGGRRVAVSRTIRRKLRRANLGRLVGKTPLSLFTDPFVTRVESRLANDLRKLEFVTAAGTRP